MHILKDLHLVEDPTYDDRWGLTNALREAQRSDHTTQVGAYIQGQSAHNQTIVGTHRAHAETRVLYLCARAGVPVHGKTMYAPWAACVHCAEAIVQAGVGRVVVLKSVMEVTPERWATQVTDGLNLLLDARVRVDMVDDSMDVKILMDSKEVFT